MNIKCKNCGEIVTINYCSHCGQDSKVGKLTFANLFSEVYESVFQINKGFLFTAKELFVRPGQSIRDYLNGKRKNYYKPITYLLILSTIYFLLSRVVVRETWMNEIITGFSLGAFETGGKEAVPLILIWFSNNFAYASLLLIPVFSFASFLAFSKYKLSYIEHVVLNSYVTGQQAIIYSFFMFINKAVEIVALESLPSFVSFIYFLFVVSQFFNKQHKMIIILRSLLTYILYIVFCAICLIVTQAVSELFISYF